MKQKLQFALLIGCFLVGSLSGCGGSGTAGSAVTSTVTSGTGSGSGVAGQPAAGTPADGATAPPAAVAQAKLSWSAIPESASGYKVYYGRSPGVYDGSIDVGPAVAYEFSNLAPGTYYFSVTAYDASGSESPYSNEVTKNIG